MFKIFILVSIVAWVAGATILECILPQLDGRIVGGTATDIKEHPYQVSLQSSGVHSCGGSIIDPKRVLTAAHCVEGADPSSLKVRAGSSYWHSCGQLVEVENFKIHPGYNSVTSENDAALIELKFPLTLNENVEPIALSKQTPDNGTHAVVIGWGSQTPTVKVKTIITLTKLREAYVDIISRNFCGRPPYAYNETEIARSMFCAAARGKDSCQGDSGGPLITNVEKNDTVEKQVVGIVSWGYGCARPEYPGVYTSVSEVYDWIVSVLGGI